MKRRQFIMGLLALSACRSDRILGSICQLPWTPAPITLPELQDIYVVNDFGGIQTGTSSNPFSVRSAQEFDALMYQLAASDYIRLHPSGEFLTRGSVPWSNIGWRMGKYWQIEGNGSSLTLDPNSIPDSEINSNPTILICTRSQAADLTPEQVWACQPRFQAVRNLKVDANHTALADRWRAKDALLRSSGVVLGGQNAAIEGVEFRNFGALKRTSDRAESAEAFPAIITSAYDASDKNKIAQLDPTKYIFDQEGEPSHISSCNFLDYDPASSDDQVTVYMITGNIGEPGGWNTGNWQQHFRANAYHRNNSVVASGRNNVQGHTIYQALRGTVSGNKTVGADLGYYGDFYTNRGVDVIDNSFLECGNGVRLFLSPTSGTADMYKQFSHEAYRIGRNKITSSDVNVYLDTLGPSTPTRFIRNIEVDSSLSLRSVGATDVRRITTQECT